MILSGHFPAAVMATNQGGGGNDQFTKLLLHCNGTDTSTSFPDSSPVPKTVTANGNAQVDTAQSVFGGASGLFDGTGDYLSIPDSPDWFLGNTDFAVDFRVRFAVAPNPVMFFEQQQDANNFMRFYIGSTDIVFDAFAGGVQIVATITKPFVAVINTWYHIALTRDAANWRVFVDGVQRGSTTADPTFLPDYGGTLQFGAENGTFYFLNGWFEEIRWSKGTPRWRSNFPVPGQAYF